MESAVVTVLQSSVVYGRRQLRVVSFALRMIVATTASPACPRASTLFKPPEPRPTDAYYGEKAPAVGATDAFAPTYFGGAQRAEAAQPIALEPGVEARADIAVELETEHIIRGRLANYRSHTMATPRVSSGDTDRGLTAVILEYATGRLRSMVSATACIA